MGYFEQDATDVADGIYMVEVVEADAFTGKDGREWAKVTLRNVVNGQTFDDFMGLSHPVGRRIAGEQLGMYGVDLEQIEDIGDLALAMAELAGVSAEVGVTHDNGYLRVKVHNTRPANAQPEVPAEPVEPAPKALPDDDIPY